MIIFSFDCAIKNLGFCCLDYDENWRDKISPLIDEVYQFYETIGDAAMTERLLSLLTKIDACLNNIVKIVHLNIFDLVPEGKVKTVKYSDVLSRLKFVLYCLSRQLPVPDVVLIENQMNVNDKARGISRYIEEFYIPLSDDVNITYAFDAYPLVVSEISDSTIYKSSTVVKIVNPNLKNSFSCSSDLSSKHSHFTDQYSTNYSANKAHTTHNFKIFMDAFKMSDVYADVPNKLDDISDAFMMALGYIRTIKN